MRNEKWFIPLKFLLEGNTSRYVIPELITLEVASKIISERKKVGWIFRGEYVVGVGGEILLTHIITHVKL